MRLHCLAVYAVVLVASTAAVANEFCGKVISVSYFKSDSVVLLKELRDANTGAPIRSTGVRLQDRGVNLKVSKVIAQLTIQDSERMQEDLANQKFDWHYLAGDQHHPHPYAEDFEVCVDADLKSAGPRGEIATVKRLIDILEDGHSVVDLAD